MNYGMYRRNPQLWQSHPITYQDLLQELWEPKQTPMENESASDFKDCIAYWSNPYKGFAVRYGLSKLPDIEVLPIIDYHDFVFNGAQDRDYTFQPTFVNECIANAWLRNEFTSPKYGCPIYKSEHPVELFSDDFYNFFYNKWLPLINHWWVLSWSDADKFSLLGNLMTNAPLKNPTTIAKAENGGGNTSALPQPIQLIVWFPTMEAIMKFRETRAEMYPPFLIEKINIVLSPDFHRHLTRRLQDARQYRADVLRVRELVGGSKPSGDPSAKTVDAAVATDTNNNNKRVRNN